MSYNKMELFYEILLVVDKDKNNIEQLVLIKFVL